MAYKTIQIRGENLEPVKHFQIEARVDAASLPHQFSSGERCAVGSKALCEEDGSVWLLGLDNAWKEQVGTTTLAQTAVSVGASTTAVLAANADRKYALLVNDSDAVIYLAIGADAALNAGIRINAGGGSYEMFSANGNLDIGEINAISSAAGKTLLVTEGE